MNTKAEYAQAFRLARLIRKNRLDLKKPQGLCDRAYIRLALYSCEEELHSMNLHVTLAANQSLLAREDQSLFDYTQRPLGEK